MIKYGFTKELDMSFDGAVEAITAALKKEGFGILTKIDVKEKFKEKLGIDFRNYVILGACSPAHAHKAIQAEENIGLLLPCNMIVYEKGGKTAVSVIKPSVAMGSVENESLRPLALEVETLLKRAFDAVV